MKEIYYDNSATTKIDPRVLEAMLPFLQDSFSNPSSLHSFGKVARNAVELARQQIAECVGAQPHEILFTSCGTESDNWAIKSTAYARRDRGMHLITSCIEHPAVLNCFAFLEREGFSASLLPVDKYGRVSVDDLRAFISPGTTVVSVMMANNEVGTIQDVKLLAEVAHEHSVVMHTDAVQAIGHIPVNVIDLGVDLLSASAHKFNGPKGVGFLYKRAGISLPSMMDGGHQEFGVRGGTENVAGIVGMACALNNHVTNLRQNICHIDRLATLIRSRVLAYIPEAKFNGCPSQRLPGLISLSLVGVSAESVLHLLDLKRIFVSTGAACNSRNTAISHVLQALNLPIDHSVGTLRISLSKDTTEAEALTIADTIVSLYFKLYK
ncbi:MAG: cysteine desulfurase family protein [bacterium]